MYESLGSFKALGFDIKTVLTSMCSLSIYSNVKKAEIISSLNGKTVQGSHLGLEFSLWDD